MTVNSQASILRTADSPGFANSQSFEATADLFTDAESLVCFDPATMCLSGIAATNFWENTESVFAQFLNAAGRVRSADSFSAAQYRNRLEAAARTRLLNARLAAMAAIREILMVALACWILSFVAWQIRDTSPRRILR